MNRNSIIFKTIILVFISGLLLVACGVPTTPTIQSTKTPSKTIETSLPTSTKIVTATKTPTETAIPPTATLTPAINVTKSGYIASDETWRDEIHITGDITIAPNATLTIEPGTMVYIASFSDDQHGGEAWADEYVLGHEDPTGHNEWKKNAISITGRIMAVGTKEEPITFTSEGDSTSTAQWDSIVITDGKLKHCIVENTQIGVNVQGPDVEIGHCTIRNNLWVSVDIHATDVWVHHSHLSGGGHQTMGIFKSNALVEHNVLTSGHQGIIINGGDGIVIRNNVFLNNGTGIDMGPGSERFVNNTLVQTVGPPEGWFFQESLIYPSGEAGSFGILIDDEITTDTVVNNIVFGPYQQGLSLAFPPSEEANISHNLIWGSRGYNILWPNGYQLPNSNRVANPLFVDPENGDFHLSNDSPAIDAGSPDLLDPDGSPSDLGAYGGPEGEW